MINKCSPSGHKVEYMYSPSDACVCQNQFQDILYYFECTPMSKKKLYYFYIGIDALQIIRRPIPTL